MVSILNISLDIKHPNIQSLDISKEKNSIVFTLYKNRDLKTQFQFYKSV